MTGWRLLLTRPAQESAALATLLSDVGVYSSSLPLLDIEPLALTGAQRSMIFDLDLYSVVIVVSKPAARLGLALIDEIWPQPPIQQWFTVGAATAHILQDYGLDVAYPEGGDDSEALLALAPLQGAMALPGARVLILRGEGGRELLADRLRALGASVDYLPLYRRTLPNYAASELPRRIEAERLNGVVVSSGQGFEHLRVLAGDAWSDVARLPLFVPSPRVAELASAAGAQTVIDCRGANAAALLAALRAQPEPALQA
ncbi:uroporphyrinogen-III synthase [Pseudomonas sp. CCI3.2]|uniref:uroporphyrinogen-III synthase n=1 Tax=unclassified Pseudomonas TaxID=196821 RepID=UPI002AC96256|nr:MULTISPECIES: uroporphyrinogen-III synthase [unclassified Pseudomonas]MEB0077466.1 uroporphyrinogen-III synthase [Pseudomonas sp. MH10out]MEB0101080.1 uroporphyrinogen-III synthase [Pseudomonas sp. CCI3.2]MEB0130069.1 uroporphyrinogen-III synthase [Pseudomonas sp. CCI2.4]MEB0157179.1 uroporphyrinogen-III synthase [Pseudomonas sp. AH2 (2023)]MEB0168491.1 uroporphyrinogen-III synthase [Pseudomonas sp. CCC4.4]